MLHRIRDRAAELVSHPPEWLEISSALEAILFAVSFLTFPIGKLPAYSTMAGDTMGSMVPWAAVGIVGALVQVWAAFSNDGRARIGATFAMCGWFVLVAHQISQVLSGSPGSCLCVGIAAQEAISIVLLLLSGRVRLWR